MEVKYRIVESFYSIQGEGFHSGKAAYFIRLAGCNVGCNWCDAKESWSEKTHQLIAVAELVKMVENSGAKYVVITGGEPLMHDLQYLCDALREIVVDIFIETSGTEEFSGSFDWICLSPKERKKPLLEMFKKANELKVVIQRKEDIKWAEDCAQNVGKDCLLYLQPEWSSREQTMPIIVDYVKENPQWIISIQTHKYMDIP